jgi:hypothetical protein
MPRIEARRGVFVAVAAKISLPSPQEGVDHRQSPTGHARS